MSTIMQEARRWHWLYRARITLMVCAGLLIPASVLAATDSEISSKTLLAWLVGSLSAAVSALAGVVAYLYTRTEIKYGDVLKHAFDRERTMADVLARLTQHLETENAARDKSDELRHQAMAVLTKCAAHHERVEHLLAAKGRP